MVIRSSSARQVDALIAHLRDGSPVQREAAIARLRVIGPRAVDRLVALAHGEESDVARAAALKALEGIEGPRSRDAILGLLRDRSAPVAAAAVSALRPWLRSDTPVLDAITALALDKTRPAAARLAALDALAELPRATILPVLHQLGAEDAALAARLTGDRRSTALDEPAGARDWIAKRGATAPLSEVHAMITRIRDRERLEPSARRRQEWQVARAAAHVALAERNSRVALYDLRETFDTATSTLPLDVLNAAGMIGDASCLEPMARAWAGAGRELWWRDRLAETARAIVARENLTARSAVVKRIRERHPGFLGGRA
jgi:hypothetical protein